MEQFKNTKKDFQNLKIDFKTRFQNLKNIFLFFIFCYFFKIKFFKLNNLENGQKVGVNIAVLNASDKIDRASGFDKNPITPGAVKIQPLSKCFKLTYKQKFESKLII